jgi:hypothetical protein
MASNESGFTPLPGSLRVDFNHGSFGGIGSECHMWCSERGARSLYNSVKGIWRSTNNPMKYGLTVRCVKDN